MEKLTTEQINKAFENTRFGDNPNHKKIIVQGLLQLSVGFSTGRTVNLICLELGLLTGKNKPSKKGFQFMRENYDLINTAI